MSNPTLVKPPPIDPSKSAIENVLDLTALTDIGPDIFTNTRPLWHPPGARGIYGGAAIAQSLSAAQLTIPPPSSSNDNATFFIHSMHCYFVLAGDASIPILYHVERVREGKSFMTRTVQARQQGRCIFTTTMSFVRAGSGGEKQVTHEWPMPEGAREALVKALKEDEPTEEERLEKEVNGEQASGAFSSHRIEVLNNTSPHPQTKRTRQWIKARGTISPAGGPQAHLSALAYMSDSYFIGTVSLVHNLWRFGSPTSSPSPSSSSRQTSTHQQRLAALEAKENTNKDTPTSKSKPTAPTIGMMVSLDHTIYFHSPRAIKADEWVFAEMESPWAGDGRGLVFQRMWSREGVLLASCVQEGLVRLKQDGGEISRL